MKNEQIRQIEKKAYEIAYAMFRLSGNIGNRPIAGYLENHCLSLFDSAIYGNMNAANAEAKILEYYLRLGGDTGLIHQSNVEMLVLEIGNLNSAIAGYNAIAGNIEPIKLNFSSGTERGTKLTADIQKKEIPPEVINKELEAITNSEEAVEPAEPQTERQVSPQAAIRQSAILQRIRQSGNCRMKDIIEGFPEVSERTLRYDLERLSEQGLIERVGQSGPATSYRVAVAVSA
ncbi:MAG: hypothetical protein LiPW15_477 [Parcubacteria group bacterium LiPW_15]|nr:MAG: hypothetical protein LiPW15_477 [Parcubacteria group bacterium LiPW_15]